jgi:serine O-acetyltransferase
MSCGKNSSRSLLQADLFRYRGNTNLKSFLASYLHDPGFRYTYHLRKVTELTKKRKSHRIFQYLYNRIQLRRFRFKYGFEISPTTSIGEGFYIGHFGGVHISPFAVLGSNVNIAHNVTIGAASRGVRKGAPTLEDRVWVGTGAIIVGKVTIGHDAFIGPGAYVNFDVPPMAMVLGNPGKIVSNKGSIGYVNNIRERERPLDLEPAVSVEQPA